MDVRFSRTEREESEVNPDLASSAADPPPVSFLRGAGETDLLHVLPRDPRSLYVYWEIAESRKAMAESHFECGWEELPKRLRLYDVTCLEFDGSRANCLRDIVLTDEADNWFIADVQPDCHYCLDYGTTALDGRFIALLRSNTVTTPPDREQPDEDVPRRQAQHDPVPSEPDWMPNFTGYSIHQQE